MTKTLILVFALIITCNLQNMQRLLQDNLNSIDPIIIPTLVQAVPVIEPVKVDPIPNNNPTPTQNNLQSSTIEQKAAQIDYQAQKKVQQQVQKAKQLAAEAERQTQIQKKQKIARQQQQNRKIQLDGQLSDTERKKQQEQSKFKIEATKIEQGTRFTQHIFEQPSGLSEFIIDVPVTQQVALYFYSYIAQDNTYVRTRNVHQQSPVQIYIYENDQQVIYQGEFYFELYIILHGKQGNNFRIRFFNHGSTKLISMNVKKLVEKGRIQEKLKKQDNIHALKTQNLAYEIHNWYLQFRKINVLDFQDLKVTEGYIKKYYSWQIFQSIFCVIVCVFQIQMISKLLKGNSVV